ncbi:hypothetical protein BREVNS_0473 [Brevinematales bacterium NS]|nr:hypothetical protein BREVNS_0473 [Brevinematales bacterium NS]
MIFYTTSLPFYVFIIDRRGKTVNFRDTKAITLFQQKWEDT